MDFTFVDTLRFYCHRTCEGEISLSSVAFERAVTEAVRQALGFQGERMMPSFLRPYEGNSKPAILQVCMEFASRVWTALTLSSSFEGRPGRFEVLRVSPHLILLV